MHTDRIIGRYEGREKGPLFICLGGIHGNEPSGVQAISRFFDFWQQEIAARPGISFCGAVLGLRGNLQALDKGIRFLEKDLNRIMLPQTVEWVNHSPDDLLSGEYLEFKQILALVHLEIERLLPTRLIILDLHTTSADGGIFSIPADTPESRKLALHFHVPIVNGMSGGLDGTSLSFFSPQYGGIPALAAAFEAGQNADPLSELRSMAAIINGLKAAGCLLEEGFPNPYEGLLLEYAQGLPPVSDLLCVHQIHPDDGFRMRPGYRNFQKVKKGEHLADDRTGPIYAIADSLILMPLYQSQGSNGFFLVKPTPL
jgi:predicted deacylase